MGDAIAPGQLQPHRAPLGLDLPGLRSQKIFSAAPHPQPVGGGLPQNVPGHLALLLRGAQNGEHVAGPALFHGARRGVDIQCPQLQQAGAGKGQGLGRHIIQIAHQLQNLSVGSLPALAPEGPDAVGLGEFLGADAHAHLFRRHHGHGAEGLDEVGQQGGPGGGAQLALDSSAVGGDAGEQIGRGGGGDGHHAVGTADGAAAHVNGGGQNLVRAEQIQGVAHAGDIRHRVQRPHLVVVDVPHRAAVGLGLRLGDGVIYPTGVDLDLLRQGQAVNQLRNMSRRGVMVVMMVELRMVMGVRVAVLMVVVVPRIAAMEVGGRLRGGGLMLLLAVYGHRHVGAGNAAGGGGLGLQPDPRQAQPVHGAEKPRLVLQQLVQGGHKHVPGGPHAAFQIKCFHISSSPSSLPSD